MTSRFQNVANWMSSFAPRVGGARKEKMLVLFIIVERDIDQKRKRKHRCLIECMHARGRVLVIIAIGIYFISTQSCKHFISVTITSTISFTVPVQSSL